MTRTKTQKLRALQSRMSKGNAPQVRRQPQRQQVVERVTVVRQGNRRRRNNRAPRNNNNSVGVTAVGSGNLSSYFKTLGSSNLGHLRIQGQDFLSSLSTEVDTSIPGINLLNLAINPTNFAGTRLALFAKLYDKYIFKRLRFHFVPGNSTLTNGSIILSYDRDVKDTVPPPTPQGIREYLSMMGAKTTQIWKSVTCDCPLSDTQDFYYTDLKSGLEDRLTCQGKFLAAMLSAFSSSNESDVISGTIWVEYDCMLMDPHLDEDLTDSQLGFAHYGVSYFDAPLMDLDGPRANGCLMDWYEDVVTPPLPSITTDFHNGPIIIERSGSVAKHIFVPGGYWNIIVMYGRSGEAIALPTPKLTVSAEDDTQQDDVIASINLGSVANTEMYSWGSFSVFAPSDGVHIFFGVNQDDGDLQLTNGPGGSSTGETQVEILVYQVADVILFNQLCVDTDTPSISKLQSKKSEEGGNEGSKPSTPKPTRKFTASNAVNVAKRPLLKKAFNAVKRIGQK